MNPKSVTDTTDFCAIDYGDEICVGEKRYRVIGHAREMRFGIEDPKFWVKKAVETDTGVLKFIKLSFFESFSTALSGVKILCFRDPQKEGEILDLTRDHPLFMNGTVHYDSEGNNIRVLDIVRGQTFLSYINSFTMKYETYFFKILPGILRKLVKTFEAIRFLHVNGYRHGDIRNDHIIVEDKTGNFVWIDFDYDYEATDNPFGLDIYGIGNILTYAVGKGFHNHYMIKNDRYTYKDLIDRIEQNDFSLLEQRRLINLRKLYPVITQTLNNVLMHFSLGANVYYEQIDEIVEDLNRCLQAFEP